MEDPLSQSLRTIVRDAVLDALKRYDQNSEMRTPQPNRLTLLTEDQVSEWLDVPVQTLKDWRKKKINLPYIPLSGRKVRYDEDAVTAYLKGLEMGPS